MKLAAPLIALVICYVAFTVYVLCSYDSLPARVASHFDIMGRPNGWMSRDLCVGFSIGLALLLPGFIVATMGLSGRIPVSFVNLPNRDYWLGPERRKATSAVLLRFGLWLACMLVLFAMGLHWLIVQANLPGHGSHLSGLGIILVIGGFLTGTLVWAAILKRRFSLKT